MSLLRTGSYFERRSSRSKGGSRPPGAMLNYCGLADKTNIARAQPSLPLRHAEGAVDPSLRHLRFQVSKSPSEVDRSVCQSRVARERAVWHRGTESRPRSWQYFPQTLAAAREP